MSNGTYFIEFGGTLAEEGLPKRILWKEATLNKKELFEKLSKWFSETFFLNLPEDVKIFLLEHERTIMIYHRAPIETYETETELV